MARAGWACTALNMLAIAMELAREDSTYEDVASKFWEHFLYIAAAMNNLGQDGVSLWDEADGFYYDVLHAENGDQFPLKVRSMVGLIPLFAVETLEPEVLDKLPGFKKRLEWFIDNRPDLTEHTACMRTPGSEERRLLSIVNAGSIAPRAEGHARRERVLLALRHPRAVARASREALHARNRRADARGRLRAGRVDDRPVRRQLELARPDLVPGQLPARSSRCSVFTTTSATTSRWSARPARAS